MLISLRRKNLYGGHSTVYSPAYMEDVQKALGALQLVTSTSVLFFLLCNRGPLVYKKMLRSKKKFDVSLGLDSLRGPIDAKELLGGGVDFAKKRVEELRKAFMPFIIGAAALSFFYFLIWLALEGKAEVSLLFIFLIVAGLIGCTAIASLDIVYFICSLYAIVFGLVVLSFSTLCNFCAPLVE